MRFFLLTLLLILSCKLVAQDVNSTIDARDGERYAIVQIEGIEWFRDNLRYQTDNSFCPKDSKSEADCQYGNYYSNLELDSVCPSGWRIPTDQDWQAYFHYQIQSNAGSITDVRLDTLHEEYLSVIYRDTTHKVSLLDGKNPLGIAEFGWVQGKKKQAEGTTTFWIRNTTVEDRRFHLHVRDQNFTIHRHSHNVEDRKRKRRRFMVKCVRDL